MKNYKAIIATAVVAALSSCASSFLDRPYLGDTVLEEQYQQMNGTLERSMRGIYSMTYTVSDHDAFGKRSIDMYTDMMSSDMALTGIVYGWFGNDDQLLGYTGRAGYLWGTYYGIIHNINKVINAANTASTLSAHIAEFGFPTDGLKVVREGKVVYTYNEEEAKAANYYAQALAARAYYYSELMMRFCPTPEDMISKNGSLDKYLAVPYYDEFTGDSAQFYSSAATVYTKIEKDMENALQYFEKFEEYIVRNSKLEIDKTVAQGMYAYFMLNRANTKRLDSEDSKHCYQVALNMAEAIINSGTYNMITRSNLYSTGFNNVDNEAWMWGQRVTTETAGGLASFFGQVDVHSYSYAWAGDTKVIDQMLYDSIPEWDARKNWFRNENGELTSRSNVVTNKSFAYCPDGKFYSAKCPNSTKTDDIDREWLNDNIYMRIESMYLIAAEAAFRLNNMTKAEYYLYQLMDERMDDMAAYTTWKANTPFIDQLSYNWRIEMWGEGYGLQTFRRLGGKHKRGGNHRFMESDEIESNDDRMTFQIPSAEISYNPEMHKKLPE